MSRYTVLIATGNVSATPGTVIDYQADIASPATVTLPAAPAKGEWCRVKAPSNASVQNVTVDGNGKQIDQASTFLLDVDDAELSIYYNGTRWRIES